MQHELFDAIICPGGLPGAKTIAADSHVKDMLKKHEKAGKIATGFCSFVFLLFLLLLLRLSSSSLFFLLINHFSYHGVDRDEDINAADDATQISAEKYD